MTSALHLSMHHDHKLWESEASLWRDDIANWQKELAKAQAELKKLEQALTSHQEAIRHHASSVRLQQQDADGHEHALSTYEQGDEGADLPSLAKKHQEEAVRQDKQRAAHEDMKRRHHTAMAHWSLLLKALCP